MKNSIVLIITNRNDQSTCNVIKWLIFYKQEFIRINFEEVITISEIFISNNEVDFALKISNRIVLFSEIKSIWFWKGDINLDKNRINISDDFPFKDELFRLLKKDRVKILDFINSCLFRKKYLGNIFEVDINKLEVLNSAVEFGLKIPSTLITTKKKCLLTFQKQHVKIVSKAISSAPLFTNIDLGSVHGYTTIISEEAINNLNDNFCLTLFQNYINKLYEIRTFYLSGVFYSMAIFSQVDNKTRVDFRDYNFEKPNRTVPYQLPIEIELKLKKLLDKFYLNTASLDLAYNIDKEYILFEINPVGQYGMTSIPCNYNLDNKIAQFLYE